jgi:hypothetical protein
MEAHHYTSQQNKNDTLQADLLRSGSKGMLVPVYGRRRVGNLIFKVLAAKVWNNLPQVLRTENRFLLFMTTLTHEKMLFYILTHYKHSEISEPPYAHSNTESSTEPIFHHETTKKDVLQNV